MHMPLVSIIIPTYNGATYIAKTIESVIGQTFADWELLVVDDGSDDHTPAIVARFAAQDPRIRLIRQKNAGEAVARNHGILSMHPRAEYVYFLDHDDVCESDALETLLGSLRANPGVLAAHGLPRFVDMRGELCRIGEAEAWGRERLALVEDTLVPWPIHQPTTFDVLVLRNRIITPGQVLCRRQAIRDIGFFDPDCAESSDLDYWLRLTALGNIAFVDRVVIGYRQHPAQQSCNIGIVWSKLAFIYRKLLDLPHLSDERKILVRRAYRLRRTQDARSWCRWAHEALCRGNLIRSMNCLRHALMEHIGAYYDLLSTPT